MVTTWLRAGNRRTLDELTEQVYLWQGDAAAKRTRFWLLLTLATVIATAGLLGDSTATIIGAMIVAPLGTPIMGMAVAIVEGKKRRWGASALYVLCGGIAVVTLSMLISWIVPLAGELLDDSNIAARTSPGITDLIAAMATGVAGAFGLARKDVSDVMPGVAIAISLVPPLCTVGICLEHGAPGLAYGALLLFLSNVVAMVLAGVVVFTALGFAKDAIEAARKGTLKRSRAYVVLVAGTVLVALPLGVNTAANVFVAKWSARAGQLTDAWLRQERIEGDVLSVRREAGRLLIRVRAAYPLTGSERLLRKLQGEIPGGTVIVVERVQGEKIDLGPVP